MTELKKNGVGVWLLNPYGQILMGLRLSKHGFNTWGAPGGKSDLNEHAIDTAVRETLEETGIHLTPEMLQYIGNTTDVFPYAIYTTAHFRAINITAVPQVTEKDKCQEWRWFDLHNLPQNIFLPSYNLLRQKNFTL